MMFFLASMLCAMPPANPLAYAKLFIEEAAGPRAGNVGIVIRPGGGKESFAISSKNARITISAPDQVGAMYGAEEFAERLHLEGEKAWHTNFSDRPYLADRGVNMFLTLPWDYVKNDSDYDLAALTDPKRWWFLNDDYWTTLFNLMAKCRLNWLDLHGAWDISVTDAPNLYAYFVTSKSFPKVGVPADIKAKNLAQLNRIVEMAHERGIRVSLMAYQADLSVPHNKNPPYEQTETTVYTYTREVVEQLIRKVPKLDAIGFRIGESGKDEAFYNCYLEAVKRSGRDIPLITRSWVTERQRVLPLARASKDFSVEIKSTGEHWAVPYILAGGRMANWGSYSFEDYLSDAGSPEKNVKTWPGWPAEGGGHWPSEPYKIIWQILADGTHRIFPFYNPDWVRKSIETMKMGTVSGYSIEGEDCFYPKAPDYYLANLSDKYVDWIHQRDEAYWMSWGRLGYDPKTPDFVLDAKIDDWFGPQQGPQIARIWKGASTIVSLAFAAYCLGPDQRQDSPEMETGGNTQTFIDNEPFDSFAFKSAHEEQMKDGRIDPSETAGILHSTAEDIQSSIGKLEESSVPQNERKRFREVKYVCLMLAHLGNYFAARFAAATTLAGIDQVPVHQDDFEAGIAWAGLSNSPEAAYYRPFTEKMRMHTNGFHWRNVANRFNATSGPTYLANRVEGPIPQFSAEPKLSWRDDGGLIVVSVPAKDISSAALLYKPLPSSTFFHKMAMALVGSEYIAKLDRPNWGLCLAAEVTDPNGITARIPAFIFHGAVTGERPYLIVPAKPGPTPQIYNSYNALSYFDPSILTPDKYGPILIGPGASAFYTEFDLRTQRKILEPVKAGMKLVVLLLEASGHSLDFLPLPIRSEKLKVTGVFEGGGALGLGRVETRDILRERFLDSPGWEVLGNGVAHMKYGQGDIYLLLGRFVQRMTNPAANGALKTILESSGASKPWVIVDPGTQLPTFSTSIYLDLMNAYGIPFLTLGEVVAKEQGLNSTREIPGR